MSQSIQESSLAGQPGAAEHEQVRGNSTHNRLPRSDEQTPHDESRPTSPRPGSCFLLVLLRALSAPNV